MKKISPKSLASSRRNFTKTALSALAISPFSSLASNTVAGQKKDTIQSSPITIGGGGSVGIDVNLPPVTQGTFTVFTKPGDTLHRLWMIDKHGALTEIAFSLGSEIDVMCRRSGRQTTITILTDPYGLRFETTEFLRSQPSGSHKELFFNRNHKIERVQVRPPSGPPPAPVNSPPDKKCTLIAINTN